MVCAGCGQVLTKEAVCPRCAMPVKAARRLGASEAAALYQFGRRIRRLQQFWFLFAGLNVALGVAGLITVQMGLSHRVGLWEPWPHPPLIDWTFLGGSGWALLTTRSVFALAAGIGLRERVEWARLVTGTAAIVALTQFPIGLLLGAYTLVKLLGKRNAELFRNSS
jgi:hypothetical protein